MARYATAAVGFYWVTIVKYFWRPWHYGDSHCELTRQGRHKRSSKLSQLTAYSICRIQIRIRESSFDADSLAKRELANNIRQIKDKKLSYRRGTRDAPCQLKFCQLARNSAETTCMTSPEPSISDR